MHTKTKARRWSSKERVVDAVRIVMQQQGVHDRLPTIEEFKRAGSPGLVSAIYRVVGGYEPLRQALQLPGGSPRKPRGYWTLRTVREALETYMREHHLDRMPTSHELSSNGRDDLRGAIEKLGSFQAVSRQLDIPYRSRPSRLYQKERVWCLVPVKNGNIKEGGWSPHIPPSPQEGALEAFSLPHLLDPEAVLVASPLDGMLALLGMVQQGYPLMLEVQRVCPRELRVAQALLRAAPALCPYEELVLHLKEPRSSQAASRSAIETRLASAQECQTLNTELHDVHKSIGRLRSTMHAFQLDPVAVSEEGVGLIRRSTPRWRQNGKALSRTSTQRSLETTEHFLLKDETGWASFVVALSHQEHIFSLLTAQSGRPLLWASCTPSPTEWALLRALLASFPDYCLDEMLHAALRVGVPTEQDVSESFRRFQRSHERGTQLQEMSQVMTVLSTLRSKLRPCGVEIRRVFQSGYLLRFPHRPDERNWNER